MKEICIHKNRKVVGATSKGMGSCLVEWCKDCGSYRTVMTNWKFEKSEWQEPGILRTTKKEVIKPFKSARFQSQKGATFASLKAAKIHSCQMRKLKGRRYHVWENEELIFSTK